MSQPRRTYKSDTERNEFIKAKLEAHKGKGDTRSLEGLVFTDDQRAVLCMILNADSKGGPYADKHNLPYFTRYAVAHAVGYQAGKLNEVGNEVLSGALVVIDAAD